MEGQMEGQIEGQIEEQMEDKPNGSGKPPKTAWIVLAILCLFVLCAAFLKMRVDTAGENERVNTAEDGARGGAPADVDEDKTAAAADGTDGTAQNGADASAPQQSSAVSEDDIRLTLYRTVTDDFFRGGGCNRGIDWRDEGEDGAQVPVPVIPLYSYDSTETERLVSDITNWLLVCFDRLPYERNQDIYTSFEISGGSGENLSIDLGAAADLTEDNSTVFYNSLYVLTEQYRQALYAGSLSESADSAQEQTSGAWADDSLAAVYMEWTPDCSCVSGGVEYRMVPVDRAAGSSYYVLLAVSQDTGECLFLNTDPYCGSGGGALWISFLEDGQTGFSCLTYSGGSTGSLWRTADGGHTFRAVEYPSPMAALPDGKLYNPFVMPESVREEDGCLYLTVGQGPDGDFYGENGERKGLYVSEDGGCTWLYTGYAD